MTQINLNKMVPIKKSYALKGHDNVLTNMYANIMSYRKSGYSTHIPSLSHWYYMYNYSGFITLAGIPTHPSSVSNQEAAGIEQGTSDH